MRLAIALAASLALLSTARAEDPKAAPPAGHPAMPAGHPAMPAQAPVKLDPAKATYAIGLSVARSLEPFGLSKAELDTVIKGIRDGVAGKPTAKLEELQPQIQELFNARRAQLADKEKKKGAEILAKAAAEKGAVKTSSGLVYLSLKDGTGPSPAATDKVKVNYKGTLADGKVFDASDRHGGPASFPLNGVIPCWTEGVQKMKVGGKAKLTCPSSIAYGDKGAGGEIPPGAVLTFEVELLEILPATPPAAPAGK